MIIEKELLNKAGKPYLKITADPTTGIVKDVWNGAFGSQDNFKMGINAVLEILREGEGKYWGWLADLRHMEGSFTSSQEWMGTYAMPLASQYGLRFEAIVLPQNIFSKMSTSETAVKVKNIQLQQFGDYELAQKWLFDSKNKIVKT